MNLQDLPRPFFVLAPMDDVTDTVFRRVVAGCARPDLFFTEFVNVDGLQSPGRPILLKKLQFTAEERPLIAQIWGKQPDNFYKTAQELVTMGFAGVDINMGCPDRTIVKNGCCSALITNRPLAQQIIQAVQAGVADRVPVSVKTRLGFGAVDVTWHKFLLQQKLSMLSIHGRTTKQLNEAPADWGHIGDIRKLRDKLAPQTLLVGNGDVMNRAQGLALAKKYGLDGIMIGRGIFHDPFAFARHSPWPGFTKQQRADLFTKHVKLFAKTWTNNERPAVTLNKFCKIYINGFDGAKELREQIMRAKTSDELLSMLKST